jgi:hypothetical protein
MFLLSLRGPSVSGMYVGIYLYTGHMYVYLKKTGLGWYPKQNKRKAPLPSF